MTTHHRYEQVGDVKIFYRKAGLPTSPTVILLHGFAASSYMWRDVIAGLADKYHVIAPDLPAFGFSESPDRAHYTYAFANITNTIEQFAQQLNLDRYALAVHGYGAPVAWRLALAHPERITAIISQNGNAYEEGLAKGWDPIRTYWQNPSEQNRQALKDFPTPASIKWQYLEGVSDPSTVAPDGYTLEGLQIMRPGIKDIQLDLLLDYASRFRNTPNSRRSFTIISRHC